MLLRYQSRSILGIPTILAIPRIPPYLLAVAICALEALTPNSELYVVAFVFPSTDKGVCQLRLERIAVSTVNMIAVRGVGGGGQIGLAYGSGAGAAVIPHLHDSE